MRGGAAQSRIRHAKAFPTKLGKVPMRSMGGWGVVGKFEAMFGWRGCLCRSGKRRDQRATPHPSPLRGATFPTSGGEGFGCASFHPVHAADPTGLAAACAAPACAPP